MGKAQLNSIICAIFKGCWSATALCSLCYQLYSRFTLLEESSSSSSSVTLCKWYCRYSLTASNHCDALSPHGGKGVVFMAKTSLSLDRFDAVIPASLIAAAVRATTAVN